MKALNCSRYHGLMPAELLVQKHLQEAMLQHLQWPLEDIHVRYTCTTHTNQVIKTTDISNIQVSKETCQVDESNKDNTGFPNSESST